MDTPSNNRVHRASSTESHKQYALERMSSTRTLIDWDEDKFVDEMTAATGHSFYSLQTLEAFFTLDWLHLGDTRTKNRKATFLYEHSNLSLISALLFTVAAAGFLTAHELEDRDNVKHQMFAFFWCFSTFASLIGAFVSLMFLLGANEINTALQFEEFEKNMHGWLKVPFGMAFMGFTFMYIGLVLYLTLIYGTEMYLCCIIACMLFIGVGASSMLQMTWVLKRVFFTETYLEKLGITDTHETIDALESELKSFLRDLTFHTTDRSTVARELTRQAIDLNMLKSMDDDEFYQIKDIPLGEILKIKAHVRQRSTDRQVCADPMTSDLSAAGLAGTPAGTPLDTSCTHAEARSKQEAECEEGSEASPTVTHTQSQGPVG